MKTKQQSSHELIIAQRFLGCQSFLEIEKVVKHIILERSIAAQYMPMECLKFHVTDVV